ncbi:Hypothetical protein A7982_06761 [Minicystis rosea]|nr:Hypothetical protein A7982_06761 [Minicystis rosea]
MLSTRPFNARHFPGAASIAALLAVLSVTQGASAAGPKEEQARKALKQAVDEDYLETRFDDAENRLRAAIQSCSGNSCSAQLRAQLHAALGSVLAGGKKELDDARDEFIEALQLDPKIEPDPGMISAGVTFAFEQAKKRIKGGPATPPDPKPVEEPAKKDEPKKKVRVAPPSDEPRPDDKDTKDKDAKDKDAKDTKEPEGPPVHRNWISLSFAPDLSIVSGTNVCTRDSQNAQHYLCVRNDAVKSRYSGTPTIDNGDNINAGVGLATLRLMLAYDRLLLDNITVGARVGFAFNGASGGRGTFVPFHLEGRFGYFPGRTPFAGSVVRPYLMISGGLAQIDTKVKVQVLEDGVACGAAKPSSSASPCTKPSSTDGVIEQRVQTLNVWKQAGLGFGALSFGVQFVPSSRVALYLAVRGNITFPVVTGVLSPEGGLSLGF